MMLLASTHRIIIMFCSSVLLIAISAVFRELAGVKQN